MAKKDRFVTCVMRTELSPDFATPEKRSVITVLPDCKETRCVFSEFSPCMFDEACLDEEPVVEQNFGKRKMCGSLPARSGV